MERMDEYRTARRVLITEVSADWVPRLVGWMLGSGFEQQRDDWRLHDNAQKIGEPWCIYRRLSATLQFLLGFWVLSDHPTSTYWLNIWIEVGCCLGKL